MTRDELLNHLDTSLDDLRWVVDELLALKDNPKVDEDYKLEWESNQNLTKEFFEGLNKLTFAVSEYCGKEGSPLR
jgi:hypothetical protein